MKQVKTVTAILLTLSLASANSALAEGHKKGERMAKVAEKKFDKLDADDNQLLTLDEMTAKLEERTAKALQRLDTDQSGGLSLEEFSAKRKAQDLSDYADEIVACMADLKDAEEGSLIMVPEASKFTSVEAKFASLDTTGDGEIDAQEMQDAKSAKVAAAFDAMDTDDSGDVSLDEYIAFGEAKKATRKAMRTCISDLVDLD